MLVATVEKMAAAGSGTLIYHRHFYIKLHCRANT